MTFEPLRTWTLNLEMDFLMHLGYWLQRLVTRKDSYTSVCTPITLCHRQRALARSMRRFERLEPRAVLASDFGDAPDTNSGAGTGDYQTLPANGGPSHVIDSTQTTLFLGVRVDSEANATPSIRANGDDVSSTSRDDEDSVVDAARDLAMTIGAAPIVRVRATNTTGTAATLYGWIDFNRDGVFDNTTERASALVPSGSENRTFSLTFPRISSNAVAGPTYTRLRLSSDPAAANPTGSATGGEVEDHAATIAKASLGISDSQKSVKIASQLNGGPTIPADQITGFGGSLATLGDVDGDGITDLAVGSSGTLYVQFMNANGTVKSITPISSEPPFFLAGAMTSLGDIDGDGVVDLAVVTSGEPGKHRNLHILYLNSDGTLKNSAKIRDGINGGPNLPDIVDAFGQAIAPLGDIDGDGVTDIAVSSRRDGNPLPTWSYNGAVYVLMLNTNGTVKRSVKLAAGINGVPPIAEWGELRNQFGWSLASLGDLDGDGINDLAVGTPNWDQGTAYILHLNSDGTAKRSEPIVRSGAFASRGASGLDGLGYSMSAAGDIDGDGVNDLLVQSYAATPDDIGLRIHCEAHILFLNSDSTIKGSMEIAKSPDGHTHTGGIDWLGYSIASLGDIDGDGAPDFAVGAIGDNSYRGAVHILFLKPAPTVSLTRPTHGNDQAATITATIDAVSEVNVTVDLSFSGTAQNGIDYSRSSSRIVIPAGSTFGSIDLSFLPDAQDEPTETVVIDIASITNGQASGIQQAIVLLEDDDPSPISVTRSNGVLTIADAQGIATDIRVSYEPETSRILVASVTDGVAASVFRSPVEGLRGIAVNLGPESDRIHASNITIPLTVHGGAGNDTILGGGWTDSLAGDEGDDSIIGGGGRDTLSGGLGDDELDGGNSVDTLMEVGDVNYLLTSATLTGLGTDKLAGFEIAYLTGGNSNNLIDASGAGIPVGINGGMGADSLLGSNFADTLNAGTGDDVLSGLGGRDLMMGGVGNDVLDGGGSDDTLDGGAGVDTVRRRNDLNFVVTNSALIERMGSAVVTTDQLLGVEAVAITGGLSANHIDLSGFSGAVTSTIQGNGGNDTIFGSDGADVITTTSGADVIDGRGGNDVVRSGAGADSLNGGAGNDLLEGDDDHDTISGGDGNDIIIGGADDDSLSGGIGADVLAAVSGADSMSGGDGNDQLLGGEGAETMQGDFGDDRLFGMGGNDSLDGGAGADSLQGGAGTDTLLGNAGDDQVSGGAGADSIDGGAGSNRLMEAADGNVVIVGTAIKSEAIGNETPLSISRIILSGGSGKDFFDARQATVPVLLQGGAGNDTLLGGLRADGIAGGDGDDVISGGGGIDQLSGGAGFDDWLEQADSNFTVNGITVTSDATNRERVTDIERIVLIGGNRANNFNAAAAGVPVILIGGRGNDTLIGGSHADTLSGGNRNDTTVVGGDGTDSLNGGTGADTLENDPRDNKNMSVEDSAVSDIFTLLPTWIDAM